jgi:hypothetical protein
VTRPIVGTLNLRIAAALRIALPRIRTKGSGGASHALWAAPAPPRN